MDFADEDVVVVEVEVNLVNHLSTKFQFNTYITASLGTKKLNA